MSVKIRLSRQGAKKNAEYLIVAVDSAKKRDGEYLAKLGHYYPKGKTAAEKLKLNTAQYNQWIAQGAVPTQTVGQLVKTQAN